MKPNTLLILCCLLLLFSGCSAASEEPEQAQSKPNTSIVEQAETEEKEFESIRDSKSSAVPDTFIENSRKQYAGLYNTSREFEDLYIPEKAWLIGNEYIVQLMSIAGFNDASVISCENIERIEQSSFGDFASITVYDKTGQSITIMVCPDDLFLIIESIR